MGDFTLQYGQQSPGPGLGVGQLQLDPQIEAEIRALQYGPPSPELRTLVLRPNWADLDPSLLSPPSPLQGARPAASPPIVPRGAGPSTPRPGEVSDVLRAVWGIPAVQQAANRVLDQAAQRAKRDWNHLNNGQRVALVTQSALIAGGAFAGAMSNGESREFVLGLIRDRDIPVPGVDGLQLRLVKRGGQASYSNIGGSGISARAGGAMSDNGRFEGEVHVTLDLTRWVPALR